MGPEMVDIIKLAALAIIITFIGILMKKADREAEFKLISMIGLIVTITIVVGYIMQFFETVETMLTF